VLRSVRDLGPALLRSGIPSTWIAVGAKRRGAKQKVAEFAELVAMARSLQPKIVMEVGTFRGGTLWAWCRIASRDGFVVSVDLPGGPFGGGYAESEIARLRAYAQREQRIELIRADSHDPNTLDLIATVLGQRHVDVLFIDGDHSYDGVRADYETYGPLVRSGGLICFHDVLPNKDPTCEVNRLWRELGGRELVSPPLSWGGIGVLRA
jgi:predicted O-methyltransferase YrrM